MFFNPSTYTVESVTSGHPDKICDQISDAILDECIRQDPTSRVAIESFGSHGLLVIGGELTTKAVFDIENIANTVYSNTGYKDKLKIVTNIIKQSPDIAQGVDNGGAGDQGIMYGYATDETLALLPIGLVLVHKLAKGLEKLRKRKTLPWLKPDGKAQVTIKDGLIKKILISTQHKETISNNEIREQLIKYLIMPELAQINNPSNKNIEILINPTGNFVLGGFYADTGLTGRKIMVDTYGGLIPHGGGCFSGKDPTKVDRSATYMARFAAKNIVAKGLAKKCLVSVAYAIGHTQPLMIEAINENGESLSDYVQKNFDFRPLAIIKCLQLRRPIYLSTATYGHFTKKEYPWEQIIV